MTLSRRRLPLALAAAALALGTAAGCSSSPPPITARGTLTVYVGLLSGVSLQDAYPDISDGGQVTVTSSSGAVIGTGTLSYDKTKVLEFVLDASAKNPELATALDDDVAIYDFTVSGLPGGLPRYGFEVGKDRGTIWMSASKAKDPGLTLGSLSG